MSADQLARRSGYPLDLVEPLLRGQPEVISERMNHEVCEALGLDAKEMWSLAQEGSGDRAAPARDTSAGDRARSARDASGGERALDGPSAGETQPRKGDDGLR